MMTCSQTRIAQLETRIAELEKENEKLSGKYSDLWHYGCNDDLGEADIVEMLLAKGEKKRVMDVWSDVYEENRDHFEFNEDSEDENEDTDEDYYNREDEIDESDILIGIVCTVCQKVLPSLTAKEHLDINNPIHKCPHVRDSQYSEVCDK